VSGNGPLLLIHERVGNWSRQLRPRLAHRPARFVETRTGPDIGAALAGASAPCPVVLIDVGRRPRGAIEDLDRARSLAPGALILLLDHEDHAGLATLAREVGATHVWAGPVAPPSVAAFLDRWLTLAHRRAEGLGWHPTAPTPTLPEPWNWLSAWLGPAP